MATEEKNEQAQVTANQAADAVSPDADAGNEAEPKTETAVKTKNGKKTKRPYMNNQYMVLPTKSYFWTMILFCIPGIGQLACLIMALGGSRYRNKIHFARACFFMMILQAVILVGLYFLVQYIAASNANDLDQFLRNTGVGYPTDLTHLDEWVKKLEEVPQVHQYLQELNKQL